MIFLRILETGETVYTPAAFAMRLIEQGKAVVARDVPAKEALKPAKKASAKAESGEA